MIAGNLPPAWKLMFYWAVERQSQRAGAIGMCGRVESSWLFSFSPL
jgi:hypothetical protein